MADAIEETLNRLLEWFAGHDSVLVAFSGGVDSALLSAIAHRAMADKALACIGDSPSYPARERESAIELANQLGINVRLVRTQEHLNPSYAANAENRCYFCKDDLYGRLQTIAEQEGWSIVVDGTNASDLGDHRPGRIAADERSVRSPLVELGVNKPMVRALAKKLDLPVWDKPAMACLSSRVPQGTSITPALLKQIESAEDVLVDQGFSQFRVRHHGDLARIELEVEDLPRALTVRNAIITGVRRAGYKHVTLDLAGFRESHVSELKQTIQLTMEGLT